MTEVMTLQLNYVIELCNYVIFELHDYIIFFIADALVLHILRSTSVSQRLDRICAYIITPFVNPLGTFATPDSLLWLL